MYVSNQSIVNPFGVQTNVGFITTTEPKCLLLENFPTCDGKKYTFSMWVKGEGTVSVFGTTCNITDTWTKVYGTTVDTDHPLVGFTAGTYYVYQAKLEQDSKHTDWLPYITEYDDDMSELLTEIESTRSEIKQTSDMISAQVSKLDTDLSSTNTAVSELKQTSDSFSVTFSEYKTTTDVLSETLSEYKTTTDKALEDVQDSIDTYKTYITFDTEGIKIGKSNSPFNAKFTESKLSFRQGEEEKAYINYEGLSVPDTAKVGYRLMLGDKYAFIVRPNGHLSLVKS